MSVVVAHLTDPAKLVDAHQVRAAVFQVEQGISASSDFDDKDATAEQFVAYDEGRPVGTARYRLLTNDEAKVERVAVLSDQRGNKTGIALMEAVARAAKQQGLSRLVLNSQVDAAGFYGKLGYKAEGDVFVEEDIDHIKMTLNLE
jgi:predicted GNAT family N-acyltransferase